MHEQKGREDEGEAEQATTIDATTVVHPGIFN